MKERMKEEFEGIILNSKFGKTARVNPLQLAENGDYFYAHVQLAFEVYQAALSANTDQQKQSEPHKEAMGKSAALVRGDGLSILYEICDKQKTVSTKNVLEHIERTHQFMKDCAVTMRQLFDIASQSQAQDHIGDADKMDDHVPDVGNMVQQGALAKHQPCGCVICTCEHETQCQGCGAKNCGNHAVGDIPNPVFEAQQPAQEPVARVAEVHMSRYTLEWMNGQIQPQGTLLYTSPQQKELEKKKICMNCFDTGIEHGVHGNHQCVFCSEPAQQDAESKPKAVIGKSLMGDRLYAPSGEVQHYATPANLPAYVNVKWYGQPPKDGAKIYVMPPVKEV